MSVCECGNEKDKRSKKCKACYIDSVKPKDTKRCNGCDKDLPLDSFRMRRGNNPRSRCKACESAAHVERMRRNPEARKATVAKWNAANPEALTRIELRKRAKALGLDPDRIVAHFESHSGRCDICDRTATEASNRYKTLSIDHCHTTGVFRGLLCGECNLMLGKARDRIDVLESAIAYLKQ